MPAPTPTLLTPFTLSLLNAVDTVLVTLTLLSDTPPDDERNYRLAQGYQQDTGVAIGDGRVILKEFDLDVVLEPLVVLGGPNTDLPDARRALMALMENTRKLQVTNDIGVRSLPVARGKAIKNAKRWENGNQRVTLTFVPTTIDSSSTVASTGDWLS